MSKVIKGVTIYAFLILGIALVGGMIIMGTMFISSSFGKPITVFGYNAVYIARTWQDDSKVTVVGHDANTPIQVNVDAKDYATSIVHKSDNYKEVIVKRRDNILGFYKDDLNLETTVNFENSVLTITVAPNTGALTYDKSELLIYLPKDYTYDLNLKSDAGSLTVIGNNNAQFPIRKLSVETKSGDLAFSKLLPQDSTNTVVKFNELTFRTQTGEFDLTSINTVELNNPSAENKIELYSKRGDFLFNNVKAPVNIEGTDVRIVANEIDTLNFGFKFDSPKGYFNIKKIITGTAPINPSEENPDLGDISYKNIINTNSTHINIEEIVGETSITTKYGDIKIGTLSSATVISSIDGDVEITTANKYVNITNQMGKIIVKGYKEGAYFKNNKGTITATYSGTTEVEYINLLTEVETATGGVAINNIYNELKLTANNANVTLDFKRLPETNLTHTITNAQGKTTLKLFANVAFFIDSSGNVTGTIGGTAINSNTTEVLEPTQNQNIILKLTTQDGKFVIADKT